MKLRLPGANNRNPSLARTFVHPTVTYFQKKTGSWKKLHKRNHIPQLGREHASVLEKAESRSPCFQRTPFSKL